MCFTPWFVWFASCYRTGTMPVLWGPNMQWGCTRARCCKTYRIVFGIELNWIVFFGIEARAIISTCQKFEMEFLRIFSDARRSDLLLLGNPCQRIEFCHSQNRHHFFISRKKSGECAAFSNIWGVSIRCIFGYMIVDSSLN